MPRFGEKIRFLREEKSLLLREVASEIQIDQALLSKIERGERVATKRQAISLIDFFQVNRSEFLSLWLGDKIAYEIKDEDIACDALKAAEEELAYYKRLKRKADHV